MKKKIGMLVSFEKKRSISEYDKEGVILLNKIFNQYELELVRISRKHFKDSKFNTYFALDENNNPKKYENTYNPDIILFRTSTQTSYLYDILWQYIIVPDQKILEIWANKYIDALYNGQYMPKTELLQTFYSLKSIQDNFWEKIVCKVINGNGGKSVFLTNKQDLIEQREKYQAFERVMIVQEFKDFSQGYQSLIQGIHDIRICFFWDDVGYVVVRQSKQGDFRCNISSGWMYFPLNIEDTPEEVLSLAKTIKAWFGKITPSIFSLDFAYSHTDQKWYFLETNHSPWWYREGYKEYWREVYKKLALFFLKWR